MKTLIYLFAIILWSCSPAKKVSTTSTDAPAPSINLVSAPNIILYKTKKDYSKNVPVTLSDDKKVIVSYPDPSDLILGDKLSTPIQLSNGFYLDNRGINKNAAFLKLTYEEYSKLQTPPTIDQLLTHIIDRDPLVEMWDCGCIWNKDIEIVAKLKELITSGKLKESCSKIK